MQRSETSATPTEKRYSPPLGVRSMIIANAVFVLLLLHVFGTGRPALRGIAITVAVFDVFYMLMRLHPRKYESITLTKTHVYGYRFAWPGFTKPVKLKHLSMREPLAIPRDHIDKERSAKRTALDRWARCWNIWSEDGERLQVSQHMLGKAQTRELLEALGITRDER